MKLNLLRRSLTQEQEIAHPHHSEIFVKHANHAEYACGIISPPSTFTYPVESSRHLSHGHNNYHFGMASGFQSWSVSKYQHEILQNSESSNESPKPSSVQVAARRSPPILRRNNSSSAVDEEGWLTGILHLPERRRQEAANKNRFNVNTVPVATRAQLKQIYVY